VKSIAGAEAAARPGCYKERHLVECCINKLKHVRRVGTRYEKTARNFLAIITVAAIALWLR
jgi:putative transposase